MGGFLYHLANKHTSVSQLFCAKFCLKLGGFCNELDIMTIERLYLFKDTTKLATFCCGINCWSEKAADIFNLTDEERETFFEEPKVCLHSLSKKLMLDPLDNGNNLNICSVLSVAQASGYHLRPFPLLWAKIKIKIWFKFPYLLELSKSLKIRVWVLDEKK